MRSAFKRAGIDAKAEKARGALLLTKHNGQLKGGRFDPATMIRMQ